jgi:hypothetical protein
LITVGTMTVRVPRIRRHLLIVLLSHDGRAVFLHKRAGCVSWRPLQWPVPAGVTEIRALRQWRRLHASLPAMTRATVTGRMPVLVETEVHLHTIVILRLSAPVEGTHLLSCDGSWLPLAQLPETSVFPAELPLLITGYVDGWIPDGLITLDR